jgi:hypothetical protein
MVSRALLIALAALALAGPAGAAPAALKAEVLRVYPAAEANQGVAVDARSFYVVDNSTIGRYDKATGARTGGWTGDPKVFPHLNSCAVVEAQLYCASSNYPSTPMVSTVEVFDLAKLTHMRSIALGHQVGSLTWVTRQGGAWWAGFANYDGKGGEPGRDHSFTALVKFDDAWKPLGQWKFPASVLDRFAPMSNSGGVWGEDGLLYISGHDEPVVFVLRVPAKGEMLELVATVAAPIEGQAIARDPSDAATLYGIVRTKRQVVAMKLPKLGGAK